MRSIADTSFAEVRAAKAFTRLRQSTQARAFLFALYLCAFLALLTYRRPPGEEGAQQYNYLQSRTSGRASAILGTARYAQGGPCTFVHRPEEAIVRCYQPMR